MTSFGTQPPRPDWNDPATAPDRADVWMAWFQEIFGPALDEMIAAFGTVDTNSVSATSLAIGSGTKNLTVETGKSYLPGMTVLIAYTTTPAKQMVGTVVSYDSVTGALVVEVKYSYSTGTYADWKVSLAVPGVMEAAALQAQTYTAFTTTGTVPNFVLTPEPPITAYTRRRFRAEFHADGAGADVMNISGLGNKNLKQYNGAGVKSAAVIKAGMLTDIEYDGTDLVILNPLSTALGDGQTLQEVTRTSGQSYTNGTGRLIWVFVSATPASIWFKVTIQINGGTEMTFANLGVASAGVPSSGGGSFPVPAGAAYVITDYNVAARTTMELR